MSERTIVGRCHCGNIEYGFRLPLSDGPIPVRACGCSFCRKHQGVWTSRPDGSVTMRLRSDERVNRYRFGTRTAEFFVCIECGVVPIVCATIDGIVYAVVNVNTFETGAPHELVSSATNFDGESLDQRLSRRRRNWTPVASIESA
jgi:hypothetical protein